MLSPPRDRVRRSLGAAEQAEEQRREKRGEKQKQASEAVTKLPFQGPEGLVCRLPSAATFLACQGILWDLVKKTEKDVAGEAERNTVRPCPILGHWTPACSFCGTRCPQRCISFPRRDPTPFPPLFPASRCRSL